MMATYGEALRQLVTRLADIYENTAEDFIDIARDLRQSLDRPSTELAELLEAAAKVWGDEKGGE